MASLLQLNCGVACVLAYLIACFPVSKCLRLLDTMDHVGVHKIARIV